MRRIPACAVACALSSGPATTGSCLFTEPHRCPPGSCCFRPIADSAALVVAAGTDRSQGGWVLIHSAWIPSYEASVDESIRARGQFISSPELVARGEERKTQNYTQVFLECNSTERRVRRVLILKTPRSGVRRPANLNNDLKDTKYYEGDTALQPGNNDLSVPVNAEPEPDKIHTWTNVPILTPERRGSFTLRLNSIHCAAVVRSSSNTKDNAQLGTYGRVWVRDSMQIPTAAELPKSLPGEGALFVPAYCTPRGVGLFGQKTDPATAGVRLWRLFGSQSPISSSSGEACARTMQTDCIRATEGISRTTPA